MGREVYDALQLQSLCGAAPPSALLEHSSVAGSSPGAAFPVPADAVYVDPNIGDDGGSGAEGAPLLSVAAAVERTRRSSLHHRTIVLRAGLHQIQRVLELTPADSNLTIMSFPLEEVWLSGAKPLRGS